MKVFISSINVPLGYQTPRFPGLYWALSNTPAKYLYFTWDIWSFTVYWVMIFFVAAYALVGGGAAANMVFQRSRAPASPAPRSIFNDLKPLFVAITYVVFGAVQGLIVGAIIGVILSVIYRAGFLTMNTWVPFCWGLASILYHICSSYSTSSLLI